VGSFITLTLAACLSANAAELPSVDQPLKTGAKAPKDAAVVIGIETYTHIADVPYAASDAAAFYKFLVYTRGVPSSNVRLLDKGANKEMILDALDAAGKASGTVWVYFAGHGAASPSSGERMILGDDTRSNASTFEARAVKMSEVRKRATAGGGDAVLIFDTCYSGKGRGGTDLAPGSRFAVPSYAVAKKADVLEWTAAGPDELSGPLEGVAHGAFTYLALGALRGWADGQLDDKRDGKVTAEEANLYVAEALSALQVHTQRPVLAASDASRVLMSSDKLERGPELVAKLAAPSTTTAAVAEPAPAPRPAPAPEPKWAPEPEPAPAPRPTPAPEPDWGDDEGDTDDGYQEVSSKGHDCKGENDCKGQGGCAVEGQHACKGQNECMGKGGCKTN